ncbi:hypothetical protein MN032_17430 [Agromyces atrinae]|uniref:hypothetical protein n=1 Tax=Agromyces atrinae TaxID=592376 RepID=UPI001F56104A|nr:hypothetical protein [Agromyces atrinae]MCI2959469.1 hypothetical protein [Agromyces atrinae]
MRRIYIQYGGTEFSIGIEDADTLRAKILETVAAGRSMWLDVDRGEGRLEPATILITPGVAIAVIDPRQNDD